MSDPPSDEGEPVPGRAVVLGAGGIVGTAWTAGLVSGLRREGTDLGRADLIVGTSAGAIVGALLAAGDDVERLADPPPFLEQENPPPEPDRAGPASVLAVLADPTLDPEAARRRVGRLACDADTGTEQAHIARMGSLIAVREWPARRLLITAVDVDTGEPVVWDRSSGVPLPTAVASSTAMPGAYPPITIDGRRYMDGGIRSGTNADLGAGAGVLVVVDPFAHLFPRNHLERELAAARVRRVVTIEPDRDAVDVLGPDPLDGARRRPAYRAGERQAVEVADRLRRAGW
ncbi:patatin-like phospholipase family protein [Rhodococcus rhodochrous]|uniref:patatin-like phospholipase family protein n=1 Tax=Rhodococcus rhodochrous TaxID=1829 RepID=UPI000687E37C|nr:patatin-like phospholipase family protein [Rhodococcus rhodochrous]